MQARIILAAQKGCDAVDPDNMDAYNNDNGLDLTQQDAINYFTFLAKTASDNGISIGLKNALEILPQVSSLAQFAVNESCAEYNECDNYNSFLTSKAVFHIEYVDSINGVMKRSTSKRSAAAALTQHCVNPKLSTVLKTSALNGAVQYCDGTVASTQTSE